VERDAVLLAHLQHPGIVTVLDVVPDGGGFALVCEVAPGVPLPEALQNRRQRVLGEDSGVRAVSAGAAVRLVHAAALAAGAAHSLGVLHGDLKAADVVVDGGGDVRIVGVGVAHWLDDAAGRIGPRSGSHLAPEVRQGRRRTPAADVYALAVLLARLLAQPGPAGATDATARTRAAPIATALGTALAAAFADAVSDRPRDGSAFAAALAATPEADSVSAEAGARSLDADPAAPARGTGTPSGRVSLGRRPRPWRRRSNPGAGPRRGQPTPPGPR
jgi:serine/threonine-protein kinase